MARAIRSPAVDADGNVAVDNTPKRPVVKHFWFFFEAFDTAGNKLDKNAVKIKVKHVFTNGRDVANMFEELEGIPMVKHTIGDAE